MQQQHQRFTDAPPPPSTYGLASQLRTPPQDTASSFHTTTTAPNSSKKVTPAMRDELRSRSPPQLNTPQWTTKTSSTQGGSRETRLKRPGEKYSSSRKGSDAGLGVMKGGKWDEALQQSKPATPKKSSHSRSKSSYRPVEVEHHSPMERSSSTGPAWGAPSRPPRPPSPTLHPIPAIPANFQTGLSRQKSIPSPGLGNQTFSPGQQLDLGMEDSPYSTYQASQSSPNLSINDAADESLRAQVGVAQRVSRGASFSTGRKASVATIVQAPQHPGTLPPLPKMTDPSFSHIRPPRPPSPNGTVRPVGQAPNGRHSHAGTITPAPAGFRRASSLYLPNAPPSDITSPATQKTLSPNPDGRNQGLITLARRTAHVSTTPGYGWRLHLLEKLEIVMGVFLTITEAEEILSIGNGAVEKKAAARANSRKSQIGMPTSSGSSSPKSRLPQPSSQQNSGFFGKMKRALTHNEPQDKSPVLSKPAPAKVVFGQPLSVVAEYGFVTSMIAGQRHDLPGVCFSAVEEIYRRGQGTKIPGLLQLPGEPSRVAKLVNIYDSPPDYGEHHDLSIESIHNVTSLLKKYLRDLPEPVLDHRLWRLFLAACVDSTKPLRIRIAAAQIILRLLPAANFSLMVYLVAFLSQMPLFPENRLTLENVSYIFGPAAMSARVHSGSTASKFGKLVSGSMVISGPTEHQDFVGVTVKKAQDGLFWLLSHWSAVADGLLETDFDVDTDYVLERSPLPPPVNAFSPSSVEAPYHPPLLPAISTHTLDILPGDYTSNKGMNGNLTPNRPSLNRSASSNSVLNQAPAKLPSPHDNFVRGPSPNRMAPSTPPKEAVPARPYTTHSVVSAAPAPVPRSAHSSTVAESPSVTTTTSTHLGTTPDMPTSESSRSSDSTLESMGSGEKSHAPIFQNGGFKNMPVATPIGFARATPEDEFGPLGPPGTSVLDDVLEQDVETPASVYNFPSPPITQQAFDLPETPQHHNVVPSHDVLPVSAFESIHEKPGHDMVLVRSKDEQLVEAQQLQDSQRREIQKLWKELTDMELARASERNEVETLRLEVTDLKNRLATREHDQMGLREMEAKCQEANQAMVKAQEELKLTREKRDAEVKASQEREVDAEAQIAELHSQLNGIRSLLGGGLARGK